MSYSIANGAHLLLEDNANLSIATAGTPAPYPITLAIWVKPGAATPGAEQHLLQLCEAVDCYYPLTLTQYTDGKFHGNKNRIPYYSSDPATASTTSDWWLVVMTQNVTTGTNEWGDLYAYVAKQGDTSFVAGSVHVSSVTTNGESLDTVYINRDEIYNVSSGANKYAEAAIWRTLLNQSERESLLTARPNTVQASALRGYWPLESDLNAGTGASCTTALGSSGTVTADAGDHPYAGGSIVPHAMAGYRMRTA